MSEPVSDFWPTNFRQSCQNCIVGVQRNKSRKNKNLLKEKQKYVKIFSGIERKIYWLFCQICILRTQANFFSKNIFHEKLWKFMNGKFYFIFFQTFNEFFSAHRRSFSAGLSKQHSTCPEWHFAEQRFSSEKYVLINRFQTLRKKLRGKCFFSGIFVYCSSLSDTEQ